METYLLWSPSLDEKATKLSFFATAVNIQRIAKGTPEMIGAMLNDLGVHDGVQTFSTTNRFITNYLTDDPDSEDWQDSWAETWEIVVQFAAPVSLVKDQYYPRRTFEIDRSWDGNTSMFPVECVVIADFARAKDLNQAQKEFKGTRTRPGQMQQLLISLGTVEEEFFENGATAASQISERCQELGGTTTHEETRDS